MIDPDSYIEKIENPLTVEEGRTGRGFEILKFKDHYGVDCSLQASSLAAYSTPGTSAVWLGDNNNRMHLTRGQAQTLIEYLTRWVENGKLLSEE